MRRGIVVVVACWLISTVAAGCGSNSNKARAATTTVESAETQQWVEAANQGLMSSSDNPPNTNCIAHAIVDTITVGKLKAAGVTQADLRDSSTGAPGALSRSLSLATKLALGAALQGCGLGQFVGPALASGIAGASAKGFKLSPQNEKCVSDGVESSPYRLFVAELILSGGNKISNATASVDFANLLSECIDWAAIFASQAKFPFSAPESACINRGIRNDVVFKNALASLIAGTATPASSDAALGEPLLTCLTPAHLSQLHKSP
jgi:hypothetical protein